MLPALLMDRWHPPPAPAAHARPALVRRLHAQQMWLVLALLGVACLFLLYDKTSNDSRCCDLVMPDTTAGELVMGADRGRAIHLRLGLFGDGGGAAIDTIKRGEVVSPAIDERTDSDAEDGLRSPDNDDFLSSKLISPSRALSEGSSSSSSSAAFTNLFSAPAFAGQMNIWPTKRNNLQPNHLPSQPMEQRRNKAKSRHGQDKNGDARVTETSGEDMAERREDSVIIEENDFLKRHRTRFHGVRRFGTLYDDHQINEDSAGFRSLSERTVSSVMAASKIQQRAEKQDGSKQDPRSEMSKQYAHSQETTTKLFDEPIDIVESSATNTSTASTTISTITNNSINSIRETVSQDRTSGAIDLVNEVIGGGHLELVQLGNGGGDAIVPEADVSEENRIDNNRLVIPNPRSTTSSLAPAVPLIPSPMSTSSLSSFQLFVTSTTSKSRLMSVPPSNGATVDDVFTVAGRTKMAATATIVMSGRVSDFKFARTNRTYRKQTMSASRKQPRALIIGVKKGGTRALLEFVRLHPDVRAVGPETHFFDRHYQKGLEWYRRHMPISLDGQMTMEKTPSYFVTREVPRRVYNMSRDVKLLVVVRDPVTRAISDYAQTMSKRPHMKSFDELAFLNNATGLVDTSWAAIKIGVYAKHLERWLQFFPLEQFHFVSGELLIKDPAGEMAKVQDFLGVRPVINENHFYFNETKGFPCLKKSERNGRPKCLGRTKGRTHPVIDPAVVQRLRDFYRPFNAKFYLMTGINFGWP